MSLNGLMVVKDAKQEPMVFGKFRCPDPVKTTIFIDYEDGTTDELPLVSAKRLRHLSLPFVDSIVAITTAIVQDPQLLPPVWPLHSADGVRLALKTMMPGKWDVKHASRLANTISAVTGVDRTAAPCAITSADEVQPLLQCLDFSQLPRILDPWSGTQGVSLALRASAHEVITNDVNPTHNADFHSDALQPCFYQHLSKELPINGIVMSPLFSVLDLAIPLAVMFARDVVCVHCPGHYLTDAPRPRYDWLRLMKQAGRLHFIMGLPRGVTNHRCMWLMILSSEVMKLQLLRPEYRQDSIITF
jgi:hypothetical protein